MAWEHLSELFDLRLSLANHRNTFPFRPAFFQRIRRARPLPAELLAQQFQQQEEESLELQGATGFLMPTPVRRPRLVVLSPFLDKQHGTERCVAEQIEHLSSVYEIHLYSSRVEDVDLSGITWHRVSALPGPHLFGYIWWLCANRFQRWRDAKFRGIAPDIIYSPGVNCLDADVVSIHVLFSKVREQIAGRGQDRVTSSGP